MSKDKPSDLAKRSTSVDIANFVKRAGQLSAARGKQGSTGRMIFALDATMSRQATWDMACHLQSEMFSVVDEIGKLDVQLNYYRGFGECRASPFVNSGAELAQFMQKIRCQGGRTQIGKVLANARKQHKTKRVDALIFIGDAMEEDIDILCEKAGELGLLGTPMFLFQEGREAEAEHAFRELARITRGAYCRFDKAAADQLKTLLRAAALYAAGGMSALEKTNDRLLLPQLKGNR